MDVCLFKYNSWYTYDLQSKMTDISVKCIIFGVTEMNSETLMPFKSQFSPISIKLPYRHARSAEYAGVLKRKGEKPSTKN